MLCCLFLLFEANFKCFVSCKRLWRLPRNTRCLKKITEMMKDENKSAPIQASKHLSSTHVIGSNSRSNKVIKDMEEPNSQDQRRNHYSM